MIVKPSWLVAFLGSLHWTILTWEIDVGGPIEAAIDWVLGPINELAAWATSVGAWWEEFRQEVLDFVNDTTGELAALWVRVRAWADLAVGTIEDWWEGAQSEVREWIATAVEGLGLLRDQWELFWGVTWPAWSARLELLEWDWREWLRTVVPGLATLENLVAWGFARLSDVRALIDGAMLELRDLYNWWQAFRLDLQAILEDPEAWLLARLERMLARFI